MTDSYPSSIIEARARRHAYEMYYVLGRLLEDTQHSEHHCGDHGCPVEEARSILALIDGRSSKQQ